MGSRYWRQGRRRRVSFHPSRYDQLRGVISIAVGIGENADFLTPKATASSCDEEPSWRRPVPCSPSQPFTRGRQPTQESRSVRSARNTPTRAGQMETIRRLPDYEVVGVVESDDASWQRVKSSTPYQGAPRLTIDELFSVSGLQVVAVETKIRDLLPTAVRCLEAGLHVHIDKPAGDSLAALQRVQEVAQQHHRTIQMGYMYRYNEGFRFLYQAVREQWLGEIFEIHGVMSKTSSAAARQEMAEYPGGAMFELGCHLIDPLLYILGTPQNVTPFNRSTRSDGLLDNTLAVFEYPRATATVRSALVEVDGFRRRQFVVCGTEGTIVIRRLEPPRLELTLAGPQGRFSRGTQVVELPKPQGRYDGAWKDLAQIIRGEKEFAYSTAHDYQVQRAILAASGVMPWKPSDP